MDVYQRIMHKHFFVPSHDDNVVREMMREAAWEACKEFTMYDLRSPETRRMFEEWEKQDVSFDNNFNPVQRFA